MPVTSHPKDDDRRPADPKAAPVRTTETMPGAQDSPDPKLPPPTPPADQLTPHDAVKDGDGQDPPADQGDDDEDDGDDESPRKRSAVVLLPMKDGEPDMLGARSVDVVGIENNYQDCAKVRVSGSSRALSGLRERSKEHFDTEWNRR